MVEQTHWYYKKVLFLFPTGDLGHPCEIRDVAVSDNLLKKTYHLTRRLSYTFAMAYLLIRNGSSIVSIYFVWFTNPSVWD